MRALCCLTIAAVVASSVFADGSVVLLHRQVQPFDITIFAERSPLTVGESKLTLMVQNAADHSDVPDAHVTLRFRKNESGKITEVMAPATHDKASNKMLYGATVTLASQGAWKFSADVSAHGASVAIPADLTIVEAEPPLKQKWPLIVFIPVAIVLFIINRRLKRRWRPTYRQAPR